MAEYLRDMRILILVFNPLKHDTRVFMQGKALRELKAKVLTIALRSPELPFIVKAANGIVLRPVMFVSKTRGRIRQVLSGARFIFKTLFAAKRFNPNVVHANDWNTLLIGWLISKITRSRLIYDSHEYWYASAGSVEYPAIVRTFQRCTERFCGPKAAALVSVSNLMLSAIQKKVPNKNGYVVHNSWLVDEPVNSTVPRGWRGEGERLKLLYLGGIEPGRGIETLIEAISRIEGAELDIFGSGDFDKLNISETIRMDARTRIKIHSPVPSEQIAVITKRYDVGVIPYRAYPESRDLTLPNKIFEYAGGGLAILSSKTRGLKEWLEPFNAGIFFEAENPDSLEEAVRMLIAQPDMIEQLQAGSIEIAAKANGNTARNELFSLYRDVLRAENSR